MEVKEKGGITRPEIHGKNNSLSTTCKVLEILKTGKRVTAFGLNQSVGFNDSRKAISLLRSVGYPIRDSRLADRRKAYFFPFNWEEIMRENKNRNPQLELFDL